VTTPSTCPHCGAKLRKHSQAYCEYCGAPLPGDGAPTYVERREEQSAGRFRALHEHPDLPGLMTREASATALVASGAFASVFAVVFVIIALGMTGVFGGVGFMAAGGPGMAFGFVPMLVAGVGILIAVKSIAYTRRMASSPLRRRPALVVDERTSMRGSREHRRVANHVTLEFEDGSREEYATKGPVAGRVSRDDMGVAYLKADYLLDFARLRV
jgi:hypothetical protein